MATVSQIMPCIEPYDAAAIIGPIFWKENRSMRDVAPERQKYSADKQIQLARQPQLLKRRFIRRLNIKTPRRTKCFCLQQIALITAVQKLSFCNKSNRFG